MKKLILLATLALFLLAFAACGSAEAEERDGLRVIQIGFPSSGGGFAGGILGAAEHYGYLEKYLNEIGFTAEIHPFVGAAPAIHEALVSDRLDYVVYAGMASVLSRANGIEHTLISITNWGSGWAVMVGADSGIYSIEELAGRRIGYTRGASPHMYLIRVLTEAGLTFDDIVPLNVTIPEGIAGMATGSIDATVLGHGLAAELVEEGTARIIHVGFHADREVFFEPFVFIARTAFHEANPEVAVAIQRAFLRARTTGQSDIIAYYTMQSERSGNPMEVIMATALEDLYEAIPLNLDDIYVNSLRDILDFLNYNGLTSGTVDFDTWLDRDVVRLAAEASR